MRAQGQGCGMVGQEHEAVILILLQTFQNRPDDLLVDDLDRFDLILDLVAVTAFIRSFDVQINKILTGSQLIQGRLCFAAEIGVDIARSRRELPRCACRPRCQCPLSRSTAEMTEAAQLKFVMEQRQNGFGALHPTAR